MGSLRGSGEQSIRWLCRLTQLCESQGATCSRISGQIGWDLGIKRYIYCSRFHSLGSGASLEAQSGEEQRAGLEPSLLKGSRTDGQEWTPYFGSLSEINQLDGLKKNYTAKRDAWRGYSSAASEPGGQEKAGLLAKVGLPQGAQQIVDRLKGPSSVQKAVSLHIESLWDKHYKKIYGGAALLTTWFIWKSMRFTASAFVNVSESLAVTGVSSLGATGCLAFAFWYYRRRFVISSDSAYRMAMLRLNSHPGVLEIMGAPVVGSEVRASVVSGGGLKVKGWRPKMRSRRVQMIFPLKGADRKGLVSLEAKKRRGKMRLSLLALDVPLPASMGGEQRIYIEGGPKAYDRGGVLNELRRPFLSALTSEDAADEEEDAQEEEEERLHRLGLSRSTDDSSRLSWLAGFPFLRKKS